MGRGSGWRLERLRGGGERCRARKCLFTRPGADKLRGRVSLGSTRFKAGGRKDFFTPFLSTWWKRLAQLFGGNKKKYVDVQTEQNRGKAGPTCLLNTRCSRQHARGRVLQLLRRAARG
uniref:Uncharacterized protein n=1 Tax=Anser brachyrhynchus TaxID=132585 RepID=A0A8B9BSJ6_9AVES